MSSRRVKALLLACTGIGALCVTSIDANAGGLAVREQSAYGQGSSFAGIAAGGSLSSMFWNPATMTQFAGIQSESVLSGILPYSTHSVTSGTFAAFGGAGNSGIDALVPASYLSYQLNQQLWLGLSINAPYGLAVRFPDMWAGRNYAESSKLQTYNATPTIAYRFNDMVSVGVGVQIQYGKADLARGLPANNAGVPPGLTNVASIAGDGWGYGFTAGVTLTPTPTTTIGIGYRSAINQKISGTLTLPAGGIFTPGFGSTPGPVNTTLNLPDTITVGLRQRLTPQWTALAGFEWARWSRIGTSEILQSSGAPATVVATPVRVRFEWSDGWFASLGAEYQWNERLAVRGGLGFEKSPITDQVRTPLLPDNDRIWLSIGGTYKWSNKLSFDAAYSHIFVKDTPINLSAASGNPSFNGVTYIGSANSHVDIISVGLKYRWDEPAAPAKVGIFKAK
jgi:long-chain fatty acid transport protein